MRWLIKHITVTYADRALLAPGSHIADSSASLAWSYGTETVERVGSTRPALRDRGNASGTLSLPIVRDFPDFESAMAELIENKAWANAHTTGQLSLAVTDPKTGAPPSALPDELLSLGRLLSLTDYPDADQIPAYAEEYFRILESKGALSGRAGMLAPRSPITRAEICKALVVMETA